MTTSPSQIFHLDGIEYVHVILKEHNESSRAQSQIWARFASPIQIALVIIQTAICQTLRGLLLIGAGVLSLNGRVFKEGLQDLLSIPVQLIALPIIAFIAIFVPKLAEKLAEEMLGTLTEKTNCIFFEFTENPIRGRIISLVLGIFSAPVAVVKNVTDFPILLFSFNFKFAFAALVLIVKDSLSNLVIAFASLGPESARAKAFYSFSYLYGSSIWDEMKLTKWEFFHSASYSHTSDRIVKA